MLILSIFLLLIYYCFSKKTKQKRKEIVESPWVYLKVKTKKFRCIKSQERTPLDTLTLTQTHESHDVPQLFSNLFSFTLIKSLLSENHSLYVSLPYYIVSSSKNQNLHVTIIYGYYSFHYSPYPFQSFVKKNLWVYSQISA